MINCNHISQSGNQLLISESIHSEPNHNAVENKRQLIRKGISTYRRRRGSVINFMPDRAYLAPLKSLVDTIRVILQALGPPSLADDNQR